MKKQFKKGQILKFKGESLVIVVEVNDSSITIISTQPKQFVQFNGVTSTVEESNYGLLKSTRCSAEVKEGLKAIYDAYVKSRKSTEQLKEAEREQREDYSNLLEIFENFRANNVTISANDIFRANYYTNSAGHNKNGSFYGNFCVSRIAIECVDSDRCPYVYREYDHNLFLKRDAKTYKEGTEKYGIKASSIYTQVNLMNEIIAKYSDIVKLESMEPGINVDGRNLLGTFTVCIEVSKNSDIKRYQDFADEFGKVFDDLDRKLNR